ncbi:hypothetical protein ACFLUR_01885 [Chloroflexota bacterium]
MKLPVLKDWKEIIEEELESKLPTEKGLVDIIHLCDELFEESESAMKFINEQRGFMVRIRDQYKGLYDTRFHKEPPPRLKKQRGEEVLLETPEARKQAVREKALTLANIGDEITDEDILRALESEDKRLVAENPTATISTILNGFKSHFEKVGGRRGVFKRQQ